MHRATADSQDPARILNAVFNHSSFRSHQQAIIENVLAGRNTLAILPTGVGKSICFQIPALIFDGLTVVVSPLISLMKDQVDNLRRKGIRNVAYINSSLDSASKEYIYNLLKASQLKMLYVAPEALLDTRLIKILKASKLSLIAIDEIHCISIWGHNFRPDYLRLKTVICELNKPPVLGLTATATKKVEEDVQMQLGITSDVFKDSVERENLRFFVLNLEDTIKKEELLRGLVGRLKGAKIVYVTFTKTAEALARYLATSGFSAGYYHGRMEKEERKRIQNDFMSGKTEIVVATNAFGMGIDKEDIRAIIHFNLPKSIENYYQEVGRAGRDGKESHCILLYCEKDAIKLRKLIKSSTPYFKKILLFVEFLLETTEDKIVYINPRTLAREFGNSEVIIRLMLYYLEKEKAIKQHLKIFRLAQVKRVKALLDLDDESERVLNSVQVEGKRWVDVEALSETLGLTIPRINRILRDMAARGYIELEEKDVRIPVEIRPPLRDFDVKGLHRIFKRLEQNSLRKIDTVIEYVHSTACRRKFILNYFGERYDPPCNACDICNPTEKIAEGITASEIAVVNKEAPNSDPTLVLAHKAEKGLENDEQKYPQLPPKETDSKHEGTSLYE
ncbi:MAG: RecQ family ATP-dependent DNA helicase, partial [Candidatus Methanospirareceae archaeon]